MDELVRRLDALAVDDRHNIHRAIRLALHDASKAIADLRTRPTADLGEDGELVARLRRTSVETVFDDLENSGRRETRSLLVNPDGPEAADRLILYREALEGMVAAVEKDADENNGISGYTGARLSDARALLLRSGDD